MRKLSESFINDLMTESGLLNPILERVKQDHTLMFAIRSNYINIYYRGGNLLKIEEQKNGSYLSSFDANYDKSGGVIFDLPPAIKNIEDTIKWVRAFPQIKEVMDLYFTNKGKAEREFQQLVVRENNFSTISGESEYFVSDIEVADSEIGARVDMLAIRWLAKQRQNGANCRATFIEMKYGIHNLGGSAGLIKHLQDFDKLIENKENYSSILETMEYQFNQLDQLGLLNFNRSKNDTKVKLSVSDTPEVIFILANYNPRSAKLSSILDDPIVEAYSKSKLFDLKFFVSSFAGYGLHADCMLPLHSFRELLK